MAIQATCDTKKTTDKNITNAVDAPMMVTKFTKNLLNPALATTTSNGVTCTKNNDGTYTLNGTATARTFFNINSNIPIIKGVTYKVVCIRDEDIDPGNFLSCVRRKATSAEYIFNNGTFIADTDLCWLWIEVEKDKTMNNVTIKPMLTTDLEATYDDYVPYSGYDIKTYGKNILCPTLETTPVNGVTCTKNGDGTYTLNGTATADAKFSLINKGTSDVIKTVSGKSFNVIGFKETGNYRLECTAWLSTGGIYVYDSRIWNVPADAKGLRIDIVVLNGATLDNVHVKPMLTDDLDATYDDFEPYKESSVNVTNMSQAPLLGLKTFPEITHVISNGNVTVAYALTETGKYVMECRNEIEELKKLINAS